MEMIPGKEFDHLIRETFCGISVEIALYEGPHSIFYRRASL